MALQQKIEKLSNIEKFEPKNWDHLVLYFNDFKKEFEAQKIKIVTVAGTNGKGQTSIFLQKLFLSKNKKRKTMMWTSPHLININERFRFNDCDIPENELETSLEVYLEKYPNNNIKLSFYEIAFWIFCHQVVEKKPDILILEVGLGGRLDAVNLFDADVVVLTSIGRDHINLLGNNYRSILKEKLGVLRKKSSLVYSVKTKYLLNLVLKTCKKMGVENFFFVDPYDLKFKNFIDRNFEMAKMAFSLCTNEFENEEIKDLTVKDFLSCGRGTTLNYLGRSVTIFNSHNLDGHRELGELLKLKNNSVLLLFFPDRTERELRQIVQLYQKTSFSTIFLCGIEDTHKVKNVSEIKSMFPDRNDIYNFISIKNCINELKIGVGREIVVTGSNYVIGKIINNMEELGENTNLPNSTSY